MTFSDLYKEKKKEPTPASAFLIEVAMLTKRKVIAVRGWAAGRAVPDPGIIKILSERFNISGDELFPVKPKRYGKSGATR